MIFGMGRFAAELREAPFPQPCPCRIRMRFGVFRGRVNLTVFAQSKTFFEEGLGDMVIQFEGISTTIRRTRAR